MELHHSGPAAPGHGVISAVTSMTKNLFGLLVNRIELAAVELAQVRTNLLQLLLVSAFGLIAAWFALVFWSGLLVFLTWDALGWKILLIIAAVFTAIAIGIFLYAKTMVKEGRLSMPATLAELRGDRDALL
jgi:uncharacterized membrane protein YqjE